jgi:hypothetical protein
VETEDSTAIDDSFKESHDSMDVGNESNYDDSASVSSSPCFDPMLTEISCAQQTSADRTSASAQKRNPKRVTSKFSMTGTSVVPVLDGAPPLESPRPSPDVDSYNATDRAGMLLRSHCLTTFGSGLIRSRVAVANG